MRRRLVRVVDGERAAVAGEHAAREAVAQDRLGEVAQRPGGGVAGLVDVQVDVEPVPGREGEETVEVRVEIRPRLREQAEDAAVLGDEAGQALAVGPAVALGGRQRDGLQLDPAGPALAQVGDDRPADPGLRRHGVDVGAERAAAVGEGAAQAELGARADVVGGPARLAVARRRLERAGEAAVGIGGARPDLALVEVGVQVDGAGPDHPALERHAAGALGGGVVRGHGREAAVLEHEVQQ